MEHIDHNEEFKKVGEPVKGISRELSEITARARQIETELTRKASENQTAGAFEAYTAGNSRASRTAELHEELRRLNDRHSFLERALDEGRQQANILRNKLSRQPCQEAHKKSLPLICRIAQALDEIKAANKELREIRNTLEDKGYRSSALPIAEFALGADEGWRKYISENYPELNGGGLK